MRTKEEVSNSWDGLLLMMSNNPLHTKGKDMKEILVAHDWLDLHLLDKEYPDAKIWDKWIEKVGVKHAREGAWTFQGKMLLITLETDGDTVIYLCDEYELETGDVFGIIYDARQEEDNE